MPEQRARDYHRGRVVNTFAEEITAMLEGELSDPRIGACHVTEVVLAPGGKTFAIDRSEKINARMDELLGRMEKRRAKQARKSEAKKL
jgi:ribosome-binding factor A